MVMASSPTAKIRLVFDKIFTPFPRPERAEMVKEDGCDNYDNNLHKGIVWNTKEVVESPIDLGCPKTKSGCHPDNSSDHCNRITILPRLPFFLPNKGFKVTDKRYFSFFGNQSRRGPGRLKHILPRHGCPSERKCNGKHRLRLPATLG